ncbi:cellulose synthase-like protein H1 [Cynara cardunculus var. scolymus]|uniref:cellulose synthase-like protein H1 n=1 Tax=Cynara cardunculus var. scolymus TaxID=59895 RepID=UPI000D6235B1|nr:cellulose synthase-like protein H1 [Cynara cardunculus var. scolymus]
MVMETRDSDSAPLHEKIFFKNTTPRAIELVILALLVSLLVYRVVTFKDQDNYFPWLLALLCESWFTLYWIIIVNAKWTQCMNKTYPERLLDRVNESEFPAVDIFVTTADPVLEPCILTMNTVLSLLAVDYPANKLALYLSDDGCSPLILYSLVETTKFAKLWVPFCKKYNVQVRAPFRYFTPKTPSMEDESSEFKQEWKTMKNEYGILYKKIHLAAQRTFPCDRDSDFAVFADTHRSNHPTIIKVVSENKEGTPNDLPHVIYISREKNPKHHHHYKAGAMNVLTRVSGVMTNAPLMLNVDCDMYANNPQVFLHAMCMVFSFKNEEDCAFIQFPQAFYDGLKDDPFGIQLVNLCYIANGISAIQGSFYAGSNCFHRRKVIYGSSTNDTIKTGNYTDNEYLHTMFGKSIEMSESAAQALSGSNAKLENRRIPSSFIEAAIQVTGCSYEYGTAWGKQIGWMYGSTAEDILTGLSIHGKGWKSVFCVPGPAPFLGCAPLTYPGALIQQKRWATGLLEVLFTNKNPLLLTLKGKLWVRQALVYMWLCSWGFRGVPEICYAALPAYCIITNSRFLPKISESAFLIPTAILVIYTLYGIWELKPLGISVRMWWNLQRMGRVNAMTALLSAWPSVILKLLGLSQTVFHVTPKDESSSDGDDNDDANAGRFTYDRSPTIVPGVVILLVNMTALVSGSWRLVKMGSREDLTAVLGLGEVFCSVFVSLCFWEYLKGMFRNGKYGIPWSTIWKSASLALLSVQLCRRSSQWF